ncbi:MAG: hypothetical protein LWX55_02405 [Deltaproteobacteria bacterium]|jgi:chromosome segregation ATPase|nr:hypothetical protein [Deltaproteobacteria bacterium]
MSMIVNIKKMSAVGLLSLGLAIVGIGAAVFWMHGRYSVSHESSITESNSLEDINALKAEIKEIKGGSSNLERRSAKMNSELTSLRSQLVDLNQGQESIDRIAPTGLESLGASAPDDGEGDASELTTDEEAELVEAQTLELIELFEETIFAEGTDPEWSSLAELALDEASISEEMAEFNLVDAQFGTTMCRMEFSLDSSESLEESLLKLVHFAPWEGEGFIRVQDGSDGEPAQAVVYLAREGYSLPH